MCSERFRRVIAALISAVTFYECWQVMLAKSFRRKDKKWKEGGVGSSQGEEGRGEDEARRGGWGGSVK